MRMHRKKDAMQPTCFEMQFQTYIDLSKETGIYNNGLSYGNLAEGLPYNYLYYTNKAEFCMSFTPYYYPLEGID